MNQSNKVAAQKPKFSVALQTDGYQKLINNTLQDPKRAQRFIASISSAVAVNPALQECEAASILAGALLGESLNLSPSPQLGQYYLVPFYNKAKECKTATFIIGYKGYMQLAARSGQYKKINVMEIKQGELVRYNPLDKEIEVNLIQDEVKREVTPTIGYYAMFEYFNGYRETMYWSKNKMEIHAKRYSKAYDTSSSFWKKDFDMMARKTMIRQLIGKWGIMSTEMQVAFENDFDREGGSPAPEYIVSADIEAVNGAFQAQIADQEFEEEIQNPQHENGGSTKNQAEQVDIDDL